MEQKVNIVLEIRDDIGLLRIDNPPGNFLLRPAFIDKTILADWIDTNKLKGLLVTGTGKHFSAGANLEELFRMAEVRSTLEKEIEAGKDLLHFLEGLNIPVVAAIQGTCFGGGLEIALACHIKIAGEKSLFAFPETNHNLMPGLGGIGAMLAVSTKAETLKTILGGDMLNAGEALKMKIIDMVVPSNEVYDYSFNLLKKMTSGRELKVIQSVMQAFHNSVNMSRDEAMREETRMFCELAIEQLRITNYELRYTMEKGK
jgi:enoyl-CoA hydratase